MNSGSNMIYNPFLHMMEWYKVCIVEFKKIKGISSYTSNLFCTRKFCRGCIFYNINQISKVNK